MSCSRISRGRVVVQLGLRAAIGLALAVTGSQARSAELSSAMLGVIPVNQSGRVVVQDVFLGAPAQLAGLQPGDQIITLNGKSMNSAEELIELITTYEPNLVVDVLVGRNGWTKHFFLRLARRADISVLPRSQDGIADVKNRSYVVRGNGFIDPIRARNIIDPYYRALYTNFR